MSNTSSDWSHLRLRDRIGPGLRVLFVGINPGVRSAQTGHHFAGDFMSTPGRREHHVQFFDSRITNPQDLPPA